jgi:glutathione peroxidase-family protein
MDEWGLQTEPWLFLVDKTGHIAARFEGGITYPEIEPEVAKLVQ